MDEIIKDDISQNEIVAAGVTSVTPDTAACMDSLASLPAMIEVRDVTKFFKKHEALKSVSFKVNKGDAFGFIGPNGAGKTTTIRILSTLLEPTKGDALIDGISVIDEPDAVRRIIGYMPDYFGVYDGMKIWEYLDFFAAAYKRHASERASLINDVLEITDLGEKREVFVEALSTGMRQRLGIAKTLLHDPKVLILDEPASGLDPRARIELKELLKELTRMGKTILISSHILPELADICNTIGIIEAGKLLACGAVKDFTDGIAQVTPVRCIKLKTIDANDKALKLLEGFSGVNNAVDKNGELFIELSGGLEEMAAMLEMLVNNKLKVIEFAEKSVNLEDVFLKITKGVIS